jgi:hypothetical protein
MQARAENTRRSFVLLRQIFFGYGTGMAEVRLICVGKPFDGGRHEKSDEA